MARATPQKTVSKLPQSPAVKFWHSKHFTSAFIFFTAFLLFANSITGGYNLDDELVTINHRLTSKGISAIPEIFTSHYYHDDQGYSYEYRPLVLVSFAIEHQFFGDNAHVSHFFNVLLYALCCLVLLKVLLKVLRAYSPLLSVAITLLFIAHPSHTEVVASIKNRDEILGLLFALLTLWAVFKSIETSRKVWFVLIPLFFALALLGKATVISFIFIIPLALVFFTPVGWRKVLFITALLTIPSFFLLNLSSAFIKILLLLAVMGLAMVGYTIINFKWFKAAVIQRANQAKVVFSPSYQAPDDEQAPFRITQIFKGGLIPERNLFSPFPIIVTASLTALYLLTIAQFHSAVALIPLAILCVLIYRGDQRISWWATIMVGFCLTLNIGIHHPTSFERLISDPYCDLVGTYLVLQILFGKRNLFIPTFFTLILFVALHILTFGRFHVYYLILLLFVNEPYAIYGILFIHIISALLLGRFTNHPSFVFDLTRILIQVFVLLWIKINKGVRVLPVVLLVSAIALFHFAQFGADRSFQPRQTLYNLEQASNVVNPQIIAAPQDRPLNFIEESIDSSSTLSVRLGTSFHILFLYAYKAVVPYPMSFYYGYKFIYPQKISEAIPLISLVSYMLLFLTAMWLLKREPLISFGLLVFLVSVAIFANYLEPVPGMFGDRFLLIPSLGWAIILAVIIQKIFRVDIGAKTTSWLQLPVYARYTFATVLLLYSWLSFSRNMDWHDDITLMRHDINVVPQSVQAQNLLGIHLLTNSFSASDVGLQTSLRLEAVEHIKKANALYPGFFNYNFDLGRAYTLLNMPDSALVYFKAAAQIDTTYGDVFSDIAGIYLTKADYQAAVPWLLKLIQKNPNDYPPYAQLSFAYFNLKQFDLSVQTNKQAVSHFPNQVQSYINIAKAYVGNNNSDSAKAWLNRALVISPGNPEVVSYFNRIK